MNGGDFARASCAPCFKVIRALLAVGFAGGTMLSLGACATTQTTVCPPPPTPLRILIPPTTSAACNAVRCANVSFINTTHQCFVTGIPSSCECYEGQTRSCSMASTTTPKQMCSAAGVGCGVNYCVVTGTGSSATSVFESVCHDWAGCPGATGPG
jgi:hypothetical protein